MDVILRTLRKRWKDRHGSFPDTQSKDHCRIRAAMETLSRAPTMLSDLYRRVEGETNNLPSESVFAATLMERYNGQRERYNNLSESFRRHAVALGQQRDDLIIENERIKASMTSLQHENESAEKRIKALAQDSSSKESYIEKLSDDTSNYMGKVEVMQQKLQAAETKHAQLQQWGSDATRELQIAMENLDTSRGELATSRDVEERLRTQLTNLELQGARKEGEVVIETSRGIGHSHSSVSSN